MRKRLLRVSAVHGLAGMAAIMASTYKAYLGEGLGPLSWIQKFKIPHPGRVSRWLAASQMNACLSYVMSWTRLLTHTHCSFTCTLPAAVLQPFRLPAVPHQRAVRPASTALLLWGELCEPVWQVGGYLAMNLAMPTMLGWVLGGNVQNLSQKDRLPYCNLNEKPKAFDQSVRPRPD